MSTLGNNTGIRLIHLEIPYKGHRPYYETETVSIVQEKAFVEKGGFHYVKDNKDGSITLYRQMYECPHCGKSFSLSKAFFHPVPYIPKSYSKIKEVKREPMKAMPYGLYAADAGLLFSYITPPRAGATLGCAHCGFAAKASTAVVHYTLQISESETVITQKMEPKNISESAVAEDLNYPSFPNFVEILFDHANKRTFARRSEADRWEWELTPNAVHYPAPPASKFYLSGFAIATHIATDTPLRSALIEIFRTRAGSFPFSAEEITLEQLTVFNYFLGVPRSFYNSIPFNGAELDMDPEFLQQAEWLSQRRELKWPLIARNSECSVQKEIEKLIVENPALSFYEREILTLPFSGDDLLQVLRLPHIYALLNAIRRMPGIATFLQHMAAAKREDEVLQIVRLLRPNTVDDLAEAAGRILLLSDNLQKECFAHLYFSIYRDKEIDFVRFLKCVKELARGTTNYMFLIDPEFADCQVEHYYFHQIRTIHEYCRALQDLIKFGDTSPYREGLALIGIRQGEGYVAVIGVDKVVNSQKIEFLLQAPEITSSENRPLIHAVQKWASQMGIEFNTDEVDRRSEFNARRKIGIY